MGLIDRVKNIIVQPRAEWEVIAAESTTPGELYKGYIAPLAAIGPIASFIGLSLVGMSLPGLGHYRVPIGSALTSAIVAYVFALIGVYVIALIINVLAPTFGGQKDQTQALKVAAYAYTPAWVASVLQILPSLSIIVLIASLYSLYLIYLGLPVLMKAPREKAVGYTVVVIVCAIVLGIVVSAIVGSFGGIGRGLAPAARIESPARSADANAALNSLKQMGDKMDAASKRMEAAQKSGDPQAQMAAATAVMGAMLGGGAAVEPVDQNLLKAMLPDSAAGLKRTQIEAEKTGMAGLNIAKAEGGYSDADGRNINLSITDMGGTKMLAAMAGWAMVEQEKQTESGYEKTGKVGDNLVHEQYSKSGQQGNYDIIVASRFLVEARGHKVDMDALKLAVAAIDLGKLEAMKGQGVKQ